MDELLDQFLIESRELVAQAAGDFAALADAPTDVAALDSAFRAIHTLKGSVAIFALGPAERVLHHAEDILDRARKGARSLDRESVASLLSCLDQTDRWIDEIETAGGLAADAEAIAARLIGGSSADQAAGSRAPTQLSAPWLDRLVAREDSLVGQASAPLVAFRYGPDRDCFFRGEDPLAIVAGVPDLLSLAIEPADGSWPDAQDIEPFACISVLEGLSTAPIEAVMAAFRLVPDQVEAALVAPPTDATAERGDRREGRSGDLLRVEAKRVSALADGVGELLVAVHGLSQLAGEAELLDRALAAKIRSAQADLERLTGGLYRSVSAVRAVPLAPTLRRFPRAAREIAASLGKPIGFSISGETVEVDKPIADGLYEPLLHLLRNAIDHGIEDADCRAAAGKPPEGAVMLAFRREGDTIIAELSDDGAGVDPDRIRAVAIARGLLGAEDAAARDDAQVLRLIFAPGFSTAASVSDVSGRGVGMNAVETAIAGLRGTIEVTSVRGRGTTFHLRLPATALTTRLLVIEVAGERYGVALDQVAELVRVDAGEIMPVGEGRAFVLRARTVPVLELADLLGGGGSALGAGERMMLVTHAANEAIALAIDAVGSRIDTLVRPPAGLLASVPGIMGSAVLSDGGVMLVLDLAELAR